eukprot:GHUV01030963.1.p1 GENE.GHUV01030963.1~~GHUV01030963.1.p1  ORF type:complete len:114 (-),score=33.19 GHUV01030963.1:111-452(-)
MDVTEWNPKTDKYVPIKFDRSTVFEGKAAAKAALQAELGLPVDPTAPLFGYIGRLEEQKGVDILLAVSSSACAWRDCSWHAAGWLCQGSSGYWQMLHLCAAAVVWCSAMMRHL